MSFDHSVEIWAGNMVVGECRFIIKQLPLRAQLLRIAASLRTWKHFRILSVQLGQDRASRSVLPNGNLHFPRNMWIERGEPILVEVSRVGIRGPSNFEGYLEMGVDTFGQRWNEGKKK